MMTSRRLRGPKSPHISWLLGLGLLCAPALVVRAEESAIEPTAALSTTAEAKAAAPAPASLPKITIGIGDITNTYDNTSESFNLLAFLKAQPVHANGHQVEYVLIDHPGDTDYTISGKVVALYDHKSHGSIKGPKAHEFTYSHDLDFTIRKRGKKLGVFQASADGSHEGVAEELVKGTVWAANYDGIRTTLLSPVWQELAKRLEQQLATDLAPNDLASPEEE